LVISTFLPYLQILDEEQSITNIVPDYSNVSLSNYIAIIVLETAGKQRITQKMREKRYGSTRGKNCKSLSIPAKKHVERDCGLARM
jgi:hypothetical protein